VHDIGVRILRGELRPGDSLMMDPEADGETVSRTVVREAIKVLAAKGLVVARPRTGTHVRDRRYWNLMDPDVLAWRLEANPGDDFFVDVFELRRLIEPAAAGLAAGRAGPAEIEQLLTALADMERAVDDRDAYLAADLRFHTVILEASHNELLAHLGGTLRAVFRASFARTLPIARETIGQHAAIAVAIRDGDGPAAEAAMLALIERTEASLAEDGLVATAAAAAGKT
jgi:DNA-binding FadR family transcriptional regulator